MTGSIWLLMIAHAAFDLTALALIYWNLETTLGTLNTFVPMGAAILPTLFFGLHCFLVGVLILKSTFLPGFVGALMVLAGLGWLTRGLAILLSLPIASSALPYLMGAGVLGEMTLTVWLLAKGVNEQRWKEQNQPR